MCENSHLYTCAQGEPASLSEFLAATRTDIWSTLGTSRPPGCSDVKQRVRTEIITDNIDWWNGLARSRLRDS